MGTQWTGTRIANTLKLARSKDNPETWEIHGEHPFVRAQATTQELYDLACQVIQHLEPEVKEDKIQWLRDYRRLTGANLRDAQEAWAKAHPERAGKEEAERAATR